MFPVWLERFDIRNELEETVVRNAEGAFRQEGGVALLRMRSREAARARARIERRRARRRDDDRRVGRDAAEVLAEGRFLRACQLGMSAQVMSSQDDALTLREIAQRRTDLPRPC